MYNKQKEFCKKRIEREALSQFIPSIILLMLFIGTLLYCGYMLWELQQLPGHHTLTILFDLQESL